MGGTIVVVVVVVGFAVIVVVVVVGFMWMSLSSISFSKLLAVEVVL